MTIGEKVKELLEDIDMYFICFRAFSIMKWTACIIIGELHNLLNNWYLLPRNILAHTWCTDGHQDLI